MLTRRLALVQLISTLLLLTFTSSVKATSEGEILTSFHRSLSWQGQFPWIKESGWNPNTREETKTTEDPCTWFGITCETIDGSSVVTKIDLSGNGLFGTLPDLSGLSHLGSLVLSKNNIYGGIENIATCASCWLIDLSSNGISGELPDLTPLNLLNFLSLDDNKLYGTIPQLTFATRLTLLTLKNNHFDGTIPSLNKLPELRTLELSGNNLKGTIPALDVQKTLQTLRLSHNALIGTIPDISFLKNDLQYFDVSVNQLTGTVPSVSGFVVLLELDVSLNRLTGGFPLKDFSGMTLIDKISLKGNQLSGSLPNLALPPTLSLLDVSDNDFCGTADSIQCPSAVGSYCRRSSTAPGGVVPASTKSCGTATNSFGEVPVKVRGNFFENCQCRSVARATARTGGEDLDNGVASSGQGSPQLSTGAVAGIIVGAIALVAAVIVVIVVVLRQRKATDNTNNTYVMG